ncbi:MAG: formylglycine-generating enzyme family protein [Kiritimatiellae bacterium]|nr:formylglycine-generating enzyme family protein [Kiritimatiellia bacterium]
MNRFPLLAAVSLLLSLRAAAADPPPYLVVDLTGGTNAAAFKVSTLPMAPRDLNGYKGAKMLFRLVPAGSFTMGSPGNETGRGPNEDLHRVTITKPYYIGVFEVTQLQWFLVTGKRVSLNQGGAKGDARPVERVSYKMIRGGTKGAKWPLGREVDADSFLGILRAKTAASGIAFDLPTEAQWEYACRAGTTAPLNSGKPLSGTIECRNLNELGRVDGNRDKGAGGFKEHTVVGTYKPNAWGLYDFHGNVWEWCLDWYQEHLGTDPVTDPEGPVPAKGEKPVQRVYRGGGWKSTAQNCRSANRRGGYASHYKYYVFDDLTGLRLAAPVPGRKQ